MGAQFDPAVVDTPFLRQGLLNELINQRLLANVAIDNRFSVSDTTLRNYITKIPTVQANGDFSMELYRQMLAAQGLTMNGFEAGVRRDLAIGRVLEPVGMTARAPAEVVASLETALTQTRTVQLRRFAAADYRSKVDVSPADIRPGTTPTSSSCRFPNRSGAVPGAGRSRRHPGRAGQDEDLASYYEQNKTRFGQPERRRVSHIMINLPAGAAGRCAQGGSRQGRRAGQAGRGRPVKFAELARKESQDAGSAANGGDLGWQQKGALPGSLDKAAFGLNKDQVSGVVESPSGLHILKLTEIQPAAIKPLAEVRTNSPAKCASSSPLFLGNGQPAEQAGL